MDIETEGNEWGCREGGREVFIGFRDGTGFKKHEV